MHRWIFSGLAVLTITGCSDAGSGTGLEPDGPPRILQFFAKERVEAEDDEGNPIIAIESRLAFGDHPDIDTEADDRVVEAAVARDGQRFRVVVDELLRGNYLEEVPCSDGSWSQVPVGMTFDDVARCSGADLSKCEGLCIVDGSPVGILDANGDGAFDDTRMIAGAVTMTCDGEAVALDVQRSYYQPSGGQLMSASGVDSLGPAIIVAPESGIRPGAHCGISFADNIVDKQDERICAGDGCSGGETSDIGFGVEPFLVAQTEPAAGAMDVDPSAAVSVLLNAELDPATVASALTLTAGGAAVTGATFEVSAEDDARILVTLADGFAPGTSYELTVKSGATGVKDVYDDTLAADTTISWTTSAE